MVNIESNPLNGNSFMNDLRNKYMEKQTAVEYLFEQLWDTPKDKLTWYSILSKAKEMEETQTIKFAYSFLDNCFTKDGIIQKSAGEYYNETFNTKEK